MKRLICIAAIILSLSSSALAVSLGGTWTGSGVALGQTVYVSVEFDTAGGFTASVLGQSLSGSYAAEGDKVVLSAAGTSMTLALSDDGVIKSMTGSMVYKGITGALTLVMDASAVDSDEIPDDLTSADNADGSSESEGVVPTDIFAVWRNDDRLVYTLTFYRSGFASLEVTDNEPADERLLALIDAAANPNLTIPEIFATAKTISPDTVLYPLKFETSGSRVTLSPLEKVDPESLSGFAARIWRDERGVFSFIATRAGNALTILPPDGKAFIMRAIALAPENPADERFWRYFPVASGDRGDNVKLLQSKLIEAGYLSDKADGIFGKKTLDAVRKLQKENGIDETGVVDEATWSAILD